jgi:hypothetical protein
MSYSTGDYARANYVFRRWNHSEKAMAPMLAGLVTTRQFLCAYIGHTTYSNDTRTSE